MEFRSLRIYLYLSGILFCKFYYVYYVTTTPLLLLRLQTVHWSRNSQRQFQCGVGIGVQEPSFVRMYQVARFLQFRLCCKKADKHAVLFSSVHSARLFSATHYRYGHEGFWRCWEMALYELIHEITTTTTTTSPTMYVASYVSLHIRIHSQEQVCLALLNLKEMLQLC